MAGSDLFYKIGKFFGEIGGQDNLYKKNLPVSPLTGNQGPSMATLKAVPDDEIEPAERMASSFRRAQGKQQAMSIFCCLTIMIFFIVFLFLPE